MFSHRHVPERYASTHMSLCPAAPPPPRSSHGLQNECASCRRPQLLFFFFFKFGLNSLQRFFIHGYILHLTGTFLKRNPPRNALYSSPPPAPPHIGMLQLIVHPYGYVSIYLGSIRCSKMLVCLLRVFPIHFHTGIPHTSVVHFMCKPRRCVCKTHLV